MEHTWIKVDDWSTLPKGIIGCYRLTCPCGKVYIGKSHHNIYNRLISYANCRAKKQPTLFKELLNHKDFNLWEIEIITLPYSEIGTMEKYLIDFYQTRQYVNPLGLNIAYGDGADKLSPESVAKREATRKEKGITAGQFKKGQTAWNKGISPSLESREKMRGKRPQVKPWNKGLETPLEVREKQRLAKIGKKSNRSPDWKHDENSLKKMSENRRLEHTLINTKTNEIVKIKGFKNVKDFFGIKLKVKSQIVRILVSLEYFASDWRIISNGVIMLPTRKRMTQRLHSENTKMKMRISAGLRGQKKPQWEG